MNYSNWFNVIVSILFEKSLVFIVCIDLTILVSKHDGPFIPCAAFERILCDIVFRQGCFTFDLWMHTLDAYSHANLNADTRVDSQRKTVYHRCTYVE